MRATPTVKTNQVANYYNNVLTRQVEAVMTTQQPHLRLAKQKKGMRIEASASPFRLRKHSLFQKLSLDDSHRQQLSLHLDEVKLVGDDSLDVLICTRRLLHIVL